MNKDIEVVQKVKIRGHILRILELSYPTATFESAVAAGLIERGLVSSPDISEYTQYLTDKKLVRVLHSTERFGIQERLLTLTPEGVDMLDGLTQTPGVETPSDTQKPDNTGDDAADPDVPATAVPYIADASDYGEVRRHGITVTLLETGRDSGAARRAPWLLLGAKTLSYAVNVSVQLQAKARGVDDVILTTSDGFVLEGPSASVVLLTGDVFVSPDPAIGILAGTSQQSVFGELARAGHRTESRDVKVEELACADGVWLVSSVRMAVPVTHIDGTPLAVAPDSTALINRLLLGRTE